MKKVDKIKNKQNIEDINWIYEMLGWEEWKIKEKKA